MSSTKRKFERVVTFNQDRLKLKSDVLEKMISKAKATNEEVAVISITGLYRSGKSFLLNLFQIYLEYHSEVNANFINRSMYLKCSFMEITLC